MPGIDGPRLIKDDKDQVFIDGCEPIKRRRRRPIGLLGDDDWNCLREWVGTHRGDI